MPLLLAPIGYIVIWEVSLRNIIPQNDKMFYKHHSFNQYEPSGDQKKHIMEFSLINTGYQTKVCCGHMVGLRVEVQSPKC